MDEVEMGYVSLQVNNKWMEKGEVKEILFLFRDR